MDIWYELVLYAAVGFAIGGLDDLLVDTIWITRSLWRRVAIYSRHSRATVASLPPGDGGGPLAVFIPAWDEANVLGHMLRNCIATWRMEEYRIFVGCYANDLPSQFAVAGVRDDRIQLVVVPHHGPTTKADCLNHIWAALQLTERKTGRVFRGIILHDAEDVVHPREIQLFSRLIHRFAAIQIPVIPLPDPVSRWISGHYLDEFAEAHGKALHVREAIGAALPLAGVGCCIRREALTFLADQQDGQPFSASSLTEDYEMGVRLSRAGFRGAFVRIKGEGTGDVVAVRAHFPGTLPAAVRQKTRWIIGIALAGWDRLGWTGSALERWMLFRDRRIIAGTTVMLAGYSAFALLIVHLATGGVMPSIGPILRALLLFNALLLIWRIAIRACFVTAMYGKAEGAMSIPRIVVANVISIISTVRALSQYALHYRSGRLRWAKTDHKFPDITH